MRVVLIRHSKTAGNLKGRYIGTTDEPLCEEGIRLLEGKTYPAAELVYVSPMKRCRETASLIYPTLTQREEPLLRECDFGEFENKNYKEEKFDSFLTKTIILSSKRYFKKEINTNRKEQIIFDDQNYSAFIQGFFDSQNPNFESTIDLSLSVKEALKSLSAIEQSVIFLLFNEDLSQKEAAQILEIYSKTVSKIKIRAIDKLKKYFKEDFENEK